MSLPNHPLNFDAANFGAWLANTVPGCGLPELVTNHPWAQTFRIPAPSGIYYAKVLPPPQRSALEAMQLLSQHFASKVPEVVATAPDHGLLLLRDHGGCAIQGADSSNCFQPLLALYADLQAEAARHPELLALLPTLRFPNLTERFLEFFSDAPSQPGRAAATQFLGSDTAQFYYQRLLLRLELLQPWLNQASDQVPTINHCDLRPQNAARRPDGSLVLFDWDDSIVAPAGMSLHNFFSGCATPFAILCGLPLASKAQPHHRQLLETYINHLTQGGYADRQAIEQSLPGAMAAGVMHYLLSYGKFSIEEPKDREVIAKIICRRTDDLLVLLDQLATTDRQILIRHISDYESVNETERASQVLQSLAEHAPRDWELQGRLAKNLWRCGQLDEAATTLHRALASEPTQVALRRLLAELALEQLDLDAAIDHWTLAEHFSGNSGESSELIQELQSLQLSLDSLSEPETVPTIRLTSLDALNPALARFKGRVAVRLFREFGTLLLENVFTQELLNELHAEFLERYWPQLKNGNPAGSLQVGNGRFMTTLDLKGRFNDPQLYAPHFLMSLFSRLMGDEFILGSLTSVASLPGAPDMRMHKDHPALFPDDEPSTQLPTFAITTLIPLLGLNAEMGTTRVIKRSHRASSNQAAEMAYQDPLGPQGSCLLMDYRLSHQGLANRSKFVRPVLSLVYNRPWFRDAANYKKQLPIALSAEEFERIPLEQRYLFDWLFPQ